jgi:hypothetical protein
MWEIKCKCSTEQVLTFLRRLRDPEFDLRRQIEIRDEKGFDATDSFFTVAGRRRSPRTSRMRRATPRHKKAHDAEGDKKRAARQSTKPASGKLREAGRDVVTLRQLCSRIGCSTKEARVAMRKAEWDKPGDSWRWPAKEAKKVEQQLAALVRRL